MAHCDNTGDPLAGRLRKGSAGSNTVAVLNSLINGYTHAARRTATCRPPQNRIFERDRSAAVGPTRYGDRLLAAPVPTLWEPRRRAQTLHGRVAERAIAHQMACYEREHRAGLGVVTASDNRGSAGFSRCCRSLRSEARPDVRLLAPHGQVPA